jgi:hypothetical protein
LISPHRPQNWRDLDPAEEEDDYDDYDPDEEVDDEEDSGELSANELLEKYFNEGANGSKKVGLSSSKLRFFLSPLSPISPFNLPSITRSHLHIYSSLISNSIFSTNQRVPSEIDWWT